jgi:hypothetical protein
MGYCECSHWGAKNAYTHTVTLSAHEGSLSTSVKTSRARRSPACAGGWGAAPVVVPELLSAAGESAARKSSA